MSLTLKLAALAATILPFAPRRVPALATMPEPVVIDAEIVADPVETVAPTLATIADDRPPLCDRHTAVHEFMGIMTKEWGGNEWLFSDLAKSYAALSEPMRWPPIKDKTLAQMISDRGCQRIQKDLRRQKKGRPVYYVIPVEEAA